MVRTVSEGELNRVAVEGEMTIYTAAELKNELLDIMADGHKFEVNLAGVSEIDTAGLQLLILMKREAVRRNKDMSITAHSPAVIDILDLSNLAGLFGDPSAISLAGTAKEI